MKSNMLSSLLTCRLRRSALSLVLAGTLFTPALIAQQMTGDSNTSDPATQSTAGQTSEADASSDSQSGSASNGSSDSASSIATSKVALPADEIIPILQANPDVTAQLKTMVSEQLQQQGQSVTPDQISDEVLDQQISSNAALRANVTTYLHARGLVSDDDLQRATLTSDDTPGSTDSTQELMQMPGQSLVGVGDGDTKASTASGMPSATSSSAHNLHAAGTDLPVRNEAAHAATDAPQIVRVPAPYQLPSLKDLYTQIPDREEHLKRFGADVFLNRRSASAVAPVAGNKTLDMPVDSAYVIGPGDTLTISLWGGVSQSLSRTVDRDGHIFLPEAGEIELAGLSLENARTTIAGALKAQFRNAQVSVTIARLRTVRVYVVGDVQRPGAYDLSSLATAVSALYAAGGPTNVGSLRTVRHMRGHELVREVDLYDFLLHGIRNSDDHFQEGDTLLVPVAGPQVAIYGAVKRPAIYELNKNEMLSSLLEDAGGATVTAALGHIRVERIDANQRRETVTLELPRDGVAANAGQTFAVQDGDRIDVEPILPYSERVVYLEGHLVRPGRMAYRDGMRLSDALHSYQDLLPEPADRGELVRLVAPDLHAEVINFNVPDVLAGNENLSLQPFDTIRIYGRYQKDAPKVRIGGEVLRPGEYPLAKGMTVSQLVRLAGGFKRDALLDSADLTSYRIENGSKALIDRTSIAIGVAMNGTDSAADVLLKPQDVLTIHQISGWNDIGSSITVSGEVGHPGAYGLVEGERLSSVLRRAGGLRATAYPAGAILTRVEVKALEEQSRQELIRQVETSSQAAQVAPNLGPGGNATTMQLIEAQQKQILAGLKSKPSTGRMVIHISADIDSWANTPADIEIRKGDVLTIPKQPGFVLVAGQVYNSTAITFTPGKTAGWYLERAGGTNRAADRKDIVVVRANGSVVGRRSGTWFGGDVLSTHMEPGDIVVVPQKIVGASVFWQNLLITAQLASSIAITAAVAGI